MFINTINIVPPTSEIQCPPLTRSPNNNEQIKTVGYHVPGRKYVSNFVPDYAFLCPRTRTRVKCRPVRFLREKFNVPIWANALFLYREWMDRMFFFLLLFLNRSCFLRVNRFSCRLAFMTWIKKIPQLYIRGLLVIT